MKHIIFGASMFGEAVYTQFKDKLHITGFCDNAKDKHGIEFCGLTVISPDKLHDKKVIISSMYSLEIVTQLIKLGIKNFYIAFDDGKGHISINEIDLALFGELSINFQKVCLIYENNSGSNTFAMSKLLKTADYQFVLANERKKDNFYYYNILTSGIIIKTHASANIDGHINIQLWHGIGLKPLGYMSRLESKFSEARHIDWNKLDGIFSYSQMYNLILSACYGVPIEKFYITGAPRNDLLFISDGKRVLADIFHLNQNKKTILYAPTFRENIFGVSVGLKEAYLYNMPDIDFGAFDYFLEQLGCVMIMKLHPYDVDEGIRKTKELQNIKVLHDNDLSERDIDFYEVLNGFDILITDYSSLFSDYLLLDRPIIFMPIDMEKYKNDVGFLFEPYELWTPGEKAVSYDKLKAALKNAVHGDDPYKDQRNQIANIFHEYKDGNSTNRVLTALNQIISNQVKMNGSYSYNVDM